MGSGTTPERRSAHIGFDPDDDVWTIPSEKGATHVRFKPIRSNWGDPQTERVKDAASAFLDNRSPDTVANAVFFLSRMARHVPVDGTITAAALMDYRSQLPPEDLHYLGHVAAFLKFWVARGYPGVDRDILQFFNSIKVPPRADRGELPGRASRRLPAGRPEVPAPIRPSAARTHRRYQPAIEQHVLAALPYPVGRD